MVRGEGKERLADLRITLAEERSRRDGKPVGNVQALREDLTRPAVVLYVLQQLDPDANRRKSIESLVAAHERLWHLRHPEQKYA